MIEDIENYKKAMLLKVRRGPREQLQAIVGTNKNRVSDFSDSDSEEAKRPVAASAFRSPSKSSPLKRRPKAKK